MYKKFYKDQYFLLKYYLQNLIFLLVASVAIAGVFGRLHDFRFSGLWLLGLVLFVLPNFLLIFVSGLYFAALIFVVQPESVSLGTLLLVPLGILVGTVSAALMHNAAHDNFRPKWSNRLWGELCGLFQLTSFAGWSISHTIHHGAPDHPEKDAHPPGDLSFFKYANAMGLQMKDNLTNKYFAIFGRDQTTETIWRNIIRLAPVLRYLRVLLALLLCGPVGFVFLYVPFKIANALIYVDFNYRTHRPTADGGYEVLNLDHTVWFKLLNAISFGSYFHRNHHRRPHVFNPRYASIQGDPNLVTYTVPGPTAAA